MNTKIILLAFALILTTPTSSIVSKVVASSKAFELESIAVHPTDVVPGPGQMQFPGTQTGGPDDHANKAPKQPEDGKHHHFHFARILPGKRRSLLVLLSKLIITIMHICLFIYCFMHVFH